MFFKKTFFVYLFLFKIISYLSAATASPMFNHLLAKHKEEYLEFMEKKKKKKNQQNAGNTDELTEKKKKKHYLHLRRLS